MAAAGEVIRQGAAEEVLLRGCSGPSSSSSSASASVADQELHVLAVDDSYVDRKVIERLLRISSCKVTAVDSGKRALQYLGLDGENNSVGFNDLKVNLIMTDYSMPGMTGYELLKKIKGSTAFREIPVVIMSSENVLTRVDRCLEEGAEEFIMKPVKLSDVKRLKEFIMRGETGERGSTKVGKRKLQDGVLSSSLVEERGSTKIGKRKLQDGILSSSLVESSSPSESPPCELALSALSSSTPTSTMPSPKRTKLETGE